VTHKYRFVQPFASPLSVLATWRLGVRIFFQPVDDAGNSVFDERHLEIDEQAQSLVGEPEVGQELLPVNRSEEFDGLHLYDYLSSTIRSARNPVSMRTFS